MKQERIDQIIEERQAACKERLATFVEALRKTDGYESIADAFDIDSDATAHQLYLASRIVGNIDAGKLGIDQKELDSLRWAYQSYDDDLAELVDTEFELEAGDYVITDPCYIVKTDDWGTDATFDGSWSNPRENLRALGIPNSHVRNTIFGDWSCVVIDTDKPTEDEVIGQFGADAGLVIVAKLDEVNAYNPLWNKTLPEFCYTIIRDFEGTLAFKVTERHLEEYGFTDYQLKLYFDGKNAVTSEPVHYIGGMIEPDEQN